MTTKMLPRLNTLASLIIYSLKDRRLQLSSLNAGKREIYSYIKWKARKCEEEDKNCVTITLRS
ncbi:uncharacterized protein METZ01_LOCUS513335 [marine metagenome]|uniref:Uncharacterized protein n=1 Tax=marine metagenome TaxID=408172 RepID=A0A383EUQ2_9ZZZZ